MANLDNAHLGQTRLILLDATLVFSMAMAIWMYVLFYRERHQPFSPAWWRWLTATGIALSCVMSTKYVGLFTYFTIGGAVAVDLWNLLDIRRGLPMVHPLHVTPTNRRKNL
jgi:dolichyl-phosphate-mannose-protein mannosyltransferase